MDLKEIDEKIDEEIIIWEGQIISEMLAGNIVKEHFARGKVTGLRAAKRIIQAIEEDINLA